VAGGRRLAAFRRLAKRKVLTKDHEIPCHVLDGEDAREISLAENTVRLAMHPADQFIAFQGLIKAGKGVEDIAARFGVAAAAVRQRLKLASVSPVLIGIYRDDQMSLDQLMAFTVSDDHAAQEPAWFEQPDYRREPTDIRVILTAAQVEAGDRRVRLVGLDTYLAAGGGINRDLFQPGHEGYLTDPTLLDRLVAEKLDDVAAAVRAEGWTWVEIMPRRDYAVLNSFWRVYPEPQPLPEGRQLERDRLAEQYDTLIEEHGDEPEPDVAEQLDALLREVDSIDASAAAWRPEDLAIAGAVISIGPNGAVEIERGHVRGEDKAALRQGSRPREGHDVSVKGASDQTSPLPSSLIAALTAERTAALRAVMQDNETVALAALCHALALPVFYGFGERVESCLDLRVVSRDLNRDAARIEDGGAMILLAARQADCKSVFRNRPPICSAGCCGKTRQGWSACSVSARR
jgi:ParB family chromosome partitioning protein